MFCFIFQLNDACLPEEEVDFDWKTSVFLISIIKCICMSVLKRKLYTQKVFI